MLAILFGSNALGRRQTNQDLSDEERRKMDYYLYHQNLLQVIQIEAVYFCFN